MRLPFVLAIKSRLEAEKTEHDFSMIQIEGPNSFRSSDIDFFCGSDQFLGNLDEGRQL
jgi:hypothetical protein